MNPRYPQSRHRGFTLIELLTVIAIIGILAAIIIPVVGRVRASAQQAQGVQNLRQAAIGCFLYAQDNRDRLPYAFADNTSWHTVVGAYIGPGSAEFGDRTARHAIFVDPLAKVKEGSFHYSGTPIVFADKIDGLDNRYRLERAARRGSTLILISDGCQAYSGDASADLWAVRYVQGIATDFNPTATDHERTLADSRGPDVDDGSGGGYIRWRMPGGKAKFAFADGHVSVLSPDQVVRRHFRPE